MKYVVLFLLLICGSTCLLAQDTIYKKSKARVLAKVTSIDGDTVSYHRASMPDGPIYHLAKSDIIWIRYENGKADSFVVAPKIVPVAPLTTIGGGSSGSDTRYVPRMGDGGERIEIGSGRYFYVNNRRWNQKRVSKLLETSKDPQVYKYLHQSWNQKGLSTVCTVSSIPLSVVGGFSLLLGLATQSLASNSGGTVVDNSGSYYATGVTCLVSAAATSVLGVIYKKRSRDSYLRAVQLYNASIL
jgi:hypothetical protein